MPVKKDCAKYKVETLVVAYHVKQSMHMTEVVGLLLIIAPEPKVAYKIFLIEFCENKWTKIYNAKGHS